MKRPVVIVAVALALILGAAGIGWLYFRLTPGAWESFLTQMRGEGGPRPARPSVSRPRPRGGTLTASGTIEGREVTVASEYGGRVRQVSVEEGDTVAEGDVVLQLDQALPRTQQEQAEAAVSQAEAALRAARAQLQQARTGARPQEITMAESDLSSSEASRAVAQAQLERAQKEVDAAQARLQAAQEQLAAARADKKTARAQVDAAGATLARLRNGATTEEIAIAEHQVKAAENELWGAQAQRDAICGRVDRGATEADCDNAEAAVGVATEQVNIAELQLQQLRSGARDEDIAAAEARVAQARGGVEAAEANIGAAQANVDAAKVAVAIARAGAAAAQANVEMAGSQVRRAEAALDLTTAGARSERIDMLEAQVQEAEAGLARAQASLRASEIRMQRTTLTAPTGGTVVDLLVHAGELATPGAPLVTLVNLDELTLTVYVPEAQLGLVSLNQEVEITVDAYEGAFVGHVSHIASQAEFTPQRVQTPEERVHMVFAVEISLDNPEGRLKPGMPADAVFQ